MAKIELNSVTSGYNLSAINDNFQRVEDELKNKVMYVDEVSPMERALDMNGQDILNADSIVAQRVQIGNIVLTDAEFNPESSAALRGDLAGTGGAGLVGSNDGASGTLWTTVAGFISRIRSSLGAATVRTQKTGAGSVLRTVADLLDRRVSPSEYGTVAQMMTAERATRRVIELDRTLTALPATLAIDVVTPNSENGLVFRGSGWSLASDSSSSGFSGYGLTSPLIQIAATEPTDAPFVFEDLGLFGSVGVPASSGQDGISGRVNNLTLNRALIKHMGRHGVNITQSWSSVFNGGMIFGCFGNGLHLLDASNRMSIRDIQTFGNGRSYTNPNQANIFLFSPSDVSYGAVIDNVDVSYSGFVQYGAAQISSLTVSSGVATMVFTSPHGRTTGDKIAVKRTGNLALDGDFAYTITVVNPTTITFPTSAANGTYSAAGTSVGPFSSGLFMIGHHGVTLRNFYAEDTMGHAAYIGGCRGVTFEGGFVLNSKIYIDSDNKAVQIGGIKFQGVGGLKTVEANQRAEINVLSSNVFEDGATWDRGSYFMLDGVRYGAGLPTNGTWAVGERLVRFPQVVGQPKAWVCTVAGTPGTWVSEGNL